MKRLLQSISAFVIGVLLMTTPHVLAGPAAHATTPPGDDGRIAFVRANQIYTMSPTGTNVKQLTSAGKNYRPEWSPDGRRISYIREVDGRRDVWVMSGTGSGKRAVTRTGDVTSAGASWSPDGRTLAYGASVLMLVSATTQSPTPRVAGGYATGGECGDGPEDPQEDFSVDQYLAWSPDAGASRIAVKTGDCQWDHAIAMYHPATGEFAQARAGSYREWTDLFFGPNGQLGYTERELGVEGDEDGPRLIVYPGFASVAGDTGGAPSPSGTSMAFTATVSGTAYVMRADIDGTDRRRLTVGYQPDWSRKP